MNTNPDPFIEDFYNQHKTRTIWPGIFGLCLCIQFTNSWTCFLGGCAIPSITTTSVMKGKNTTLTLATFWRCREVVGEEVEEELVVFLLLIFLTKWSPPHLNNNNPQHFLPLRSVLIPALVVVVGHLHISRAVPYSDDIS